MISVLGGRETGSGQSSPLGGSVVSTAKLEDGEYYGHLKSWNDNSMTLEVLEFLGFDSASYKYLLKNTGKTISLDISQADVWLEDDWSISGPYYNFYSIDAAVDCSLYDGSLIRDKWTKDISFYVEDSVVKDIAILYSP